MPTLLAVDLGTSHTVAVVQRDGQSPQSLLFDGSPVLPSGVYADAHGALRTGRDAERLARVEPHRFEPHPKQRIDEGAVLLGDAEVQVPALLSAILERVLAEARNAGWTAADPVVLTCPADWGPHRREVLSSAGRRAGIAAPRLVEEPVAAAAYCTEVLGARVAPGQPLLVFDFGGGTLDLALLAVEHTGFRILSVGGLENLGGLDVDSVLVGHLGHLVAGHHPDVWERLSRPRELSDVRDRATFWAEVRGAKEMLSRTTSAPVAVPGTDRAVYLTREELERLAGPLVDRAVDETRRTLDAAGVAGGRLAAILLVGGSSRIPLVATRLHTRFGVAPTVPEQPELPVALGALRAAAGERSAPSTSDPSAGRVGPRPPAGPGYPPGGAVGYIAGSPGHPAGPSTGAPTADGPYPPGPYGGTASPTTGGPAYPTTGGPTYPTSGPAFPTSGPAGPTSGPAGSGYGAPPGHGAAQGYGAPDSTSPTGIPISGIPTSGPGGAHPGGYGGFGAPAPGSYAGRPTVDSGQWPGNSPFTPPVPGPRGGRRTGLVVAAATACVLILVAIVGVVVWRTVGPPGDPGGTNDAGPSAGASASPAAPSVAAMPTGAVPAGYAWCDAKRALFCPTAPLCELDDDEVDCAQPHDVQTFAGGYLKSNAQVGGSEALRDAPEVKEGCGDAVMKERATDPAKVTDWARYSQWTNINGVNFFLCHAGPRQGSTKGSDFKI